MQVFGGRREGGLFSGRDESLVTHNPQKGGRARPPMLLKNEKGLATSVTRVVKKRDKEGDYFLVFVKEGGKRVSKGQRRGRCEGEVEKVNERRVTGTSPG